MSRIEIAVIGSGPGGISAAITASVRNKRVTLFRMHGMSGKVSKAHLIRNYPGLPDISGEDLAQALENHLRMMEVPVCDEQVSAIYPMGDYFGIQTAANIYEADAVILATGVTQGKTLPGEERLLGRGVSYCATCDAMLYRGKTVAVLGYNSESDAEVKFLSEVVGRVYYLPMGRKTALGETEKIALLSGAPKAIVGEQRVAALEMQDASIPVDGVFVLRDAIAPDKLVSGLKMDGPHVEVNLQMETNLPGCFACGDVTGKPYQYIKAAGQGNVAALSAVGYLASKKS